MNDGIRAHAYLLRVTEPPAPAVHAFVVAHGAVTAVERIRNGDLPDAVVGEAFRRHASVDWDRIIDADMRLIDLGVARLITPESDEWPTGQLAALRSGGAPSPRWRMPPLALWVRGGRSLADLTRRAVSVVGARAATGYGEHVAAELGYGLAREGLTVVSGAAYGIDGAAHRGALAAEGVTVAVLGCGIDIGYPSGHAALLDQIAGSGLVLSEYPPGTPQARHRFLVRNRLIAALSAGTVVVEAGVRSGARNTAATAAALGKEVMAVPGPITSAMSAGCHDLLRSGTAIPVSSVAEVIESSRLHLADGRS